MTRGSSGVVLSILFALLGFLNCQEPPPTSTNPTSPANTTPPANATNTPANPICLANTTGTPDTLSGNGQCNHHVSIDCTPQAQNCSSPSLAQVARLNAEEGNCESFNVTINVGVDIKLTENANFSHISFLSIKGHFSRVVCETSNVGIVIWSVENVKIGNIVLQGCGLITQIPINNLNKLHRNALSILRCGAVRISAVTIRDSIGSGLSLYENHGNALISGSSFINNTLITPTSTEIDNQILGGSGVVIYVSLYVKKPRIYHFTHCNFSENVAKSVHYSFFPSISSDGVLEEQKGRGAGMLVYLRQTNHTTVLIVDSVFERNQAYLGAGFSASIRGNGKGNEVRVVNTTFTQNGCQQIKASGNIVGLGGGAYLSFEYLIKAMYADHLIQFNSVLFDSNCAETGGGVYLFSSKSTLVANITNSIIFKESTWVTNYAKTGSATYVAPNIFDRATVGYLPTPMFKDCNFRENTIEPPEYLGLSEKHSHGGGGTLYSSLTNIKFETFASFLYNVGSGIVIVNGIVDFVNSSAEFHGNYGAQGGAIFLMGTAAIEVGPNQRYNFTGNRASYKGGAINSHLMDYTDLAASLSCFLRYKDSNGSNTLYPSREWLAALTFKNNSAKVGHTIYTTSIIPCQVVAAPPTAGSSKRTKYEVLNRSEIFQPPGVEILDWDEKTYHIATEGSHFDQNMTSLLRIIPGKSKDLGIRMLDDFEHKASSILTAYVLKGDIMINYDHSDSTENSILLSGREGETGELLLQTIGSRKISQTIEVQLLPCPPGFNFTEKLVCKCASQSYVGIEYCDEEYKAFLTPGFWAGYVQNGNGTTLATSLCPAGFCNYMNGSLVEGGEVKLPSDGGLLEESICGEKRRGILCGECRDGYTTHYHSPHLRCLQAEPHSCKFGWLFYLLSEILPVTFLFLFVIAMNVSFTTGAANGFILFSQLLDTLQIDASGAIKFPKAVSILSQGYKIIYGFFSLDIFAAESLSFCLWRDASALDILSFKYLTVVYSLLLVLSVILFMRYSAARCCGSRYSISALRNSVIHGLSGFLVLCYGQCIKVSFRILYKQELNLLGSGDGLPSPTRVLLYGDFAFFSREHLPYALPALFVLLFIGVLPPLVLIVYPLLNKALTLSVKLENSRAAKYSLYPANKLKPLLDSFQGSFKDNFRFFAGIYFVYRWITVTTYAIVPLPSLFYTIVQALLIGILVLHSVSQPYQKRWHNILDSLLFADLTLVNGITILNYYWTRVDVGTRNQSKIAIMGSLQLVLVYLPLLYAVCYMASCCFKMLCKRLQDNPDTSKFFLKTLSLSCSAPASPEEQLPYRLLNEEEESLEFSVGVESHKDT